METISSMAHTAAKAVWGDGTEQNEPASGVCGDVTKGEPYDGGNFASKQETKVDEDSKGKSQDSHTGPPTVDGIPKESEHSEVDLDKKTDATAQSSVDDTKKADPTTKSTGDEEQAGKEESVMGDGPKPLATIAKENGGDAGNLRTEADSEAADKPDSKSDAERKKEEQSKGTGEEYVKTSGLHADGGDFDATKPGAGREADRLMEEKGMEREGHPDSVRHEKQEELEKNEKSPSTKDGQNEKEKPGLKERIKDKLHIH